MPEILFGSVYQSDSLIWHHLFCTKQLKEPVEMFVVALAPKAKTKTRWIPFTGGIFQFPTIRTPTFSGLATNDDNISLLIVSFTPFDRATPKMPGNTFEPVSRSLFDFSNRRSGYLCRWLKYWLSIAGQQLAAEWKKIKLLN